MQCSIAGCPGQYEPKRIVHTVRRGEEVLVIDQVPAEVCPVCGDVLFNPETVRRIEEMLRTIKEPTRTVPLYEYS